MTNELCWEHAVALLIVTMGSFISLGGLGGIFYVCFCGCIVMFSLTIAIVVNILFYSKDTAGK